MKRNSISRNKFFLWIVGGISLVTGAKFLLSSASTRQSRPVKMLTEDGKLVEVDEAKLSAKKKKIKDEEIYSWVKKKHPSQFNQ